jgi:hypothetical protein
MQVNSAQDYLTNRKRQIIAATYNSTSPPKSQRHNSVFLSAAANGVSSYQRFIIPSQLNTQMGGARFTNLCCTVTGLLGTFPSVTSEGGLRAQDLNLAMSYRST